MPSPEAPEPADAAQFLRTRLGLEVLTAAPLAGSVANHDFRLDLADGAAVVLKAGPAEEMAAEAWACGRLSELGVPVPGVVAYEQDGLAGLATLVLTLVAGAPSEHPAVARETGRWFRRIHAVTLPGWGPLDLAAGEPRGAYDSWADAVLADLAGVPELVTAGLLDPDLARTAYDHVADPVVLGYHGPGALLHHDLKAQHLFGVGDRLSAVIDWGDVRIGDPRADLARLSMAGPTVTDAFLEGYGVERTDELDRMLARYRIAWNLGSLSYEYRAGGDWFDAYRDRVVADVALLGKS